MVFPSDEELDGLILGPDSMAWRVTSDLRLNVAMLYPLLLQVAHPTVDAGVTDHSDFEHRPWDRLLRTMDYVSLLVYGGREAATPVAGCASSTSASKGPSPTAPAIAPSSPTPTRGCTPP